MEFLPIWGWVIIPVAMAALGFLWSHVHHDYTVEAKVAKLEGVNDELLQLSARVMRLEDIRMGYNRIREEDTDALR